MFSSLFSKNFIDIIYLDNFIEYNSSIKFMEDKILSIKTQKNNEALLFVHYHHLYTAGISFKNYNEIIDKSIKLYESNRGGKITYHGPGQRVIYIMLNLKKRGSDVKLFVKALETVVIRSLAHFNINAFLHPEHVGVWIHDSNRNLKKICALGIRIRNGISYHGIAINIHPNLDFFSKIVPCGINDDSLGVTSLKNEGIDISLTDFDSVFLKNFYSIFGGK